MGSVQLRMTPSASLPSPSTGRPIQRRFQSHHQPHSSNYHNLVQYRTTMGNTQQLMTAVQQPQPTLQPPQPTLPHRFLPSPSTGRPVDYPLWEVPAPSSLMRWPLRSQHRRVDNYSLSTWRRQTTASSTNCRQPLISNHSQPTSTSATSGALHPKSATAASCRAGSWQPR
jgi:hypothetical protein